MVIRNAKISDARLIKQLIDNHMKEGFMLPRPLSELYENVRDFFVCDVDGSVCGCVGLQIVWEDLAEIKSLVVDRELGRGQGYGKDLVQACLDEGHELGLERIFALTMIPDFFLNLGFELVDKACLPHKVWADCIKCHKYPSCDEVAVGIAIKEGAGFTLDTTTPGFDAIPIPIVNQNLQDHSQKR